LAAVFAFPDMKLHLPRILAFAAIVASLGAPTAAQSSDAHVGVSRADFSGTLGWFNVHKPHPEDRYDSWANKILDAGAGVSWYWTDHLRTQVDFGATTKDERYDYQPLFIDGRPTYTVSETTFSSRHLAIAQHYQFFRNQWVHPRVGAGVDVTWERSTVETQPVLFSDPVSRQTIQLRPAHTEGPETNTIARPFFEVGYKAYMTRRAFFTNDLRLGIRHGGIDNVILRFGFGADF
jgi:Outer membrane protein beta-barrel domain